MNTKNFNNLYQIHQQQLLKAHGYNGLFGIAYNLMENIENTIKPYGEEFYTKVVDIFKDKKYKSINICFYGDTFGYAMYYSTPDIHTDNKEINYITIDKSEIESKSDLIKKLLDIKNYVTETNE